jgi:conjugative transfer region protein TrbK
MDSKLMARAGAAAFVGFAVAITIMQMRGGPERPDAQAAGPVMAVGDSLAARLRSCAAAGEAALLRDDCQSAWEEKRRRFFGDRAQQGDRAGPGAQAGHGDELLSQAKAN